MSTRRLHPHSWNPLLLSCGGGGGGGGGGGAGGLKVQFSKFSHKGRGLFSHKARH